MLVYFEFIVTDNLHTVFVYRFFLKKMGQLPIVLKHSGVWNCYNEYEQYELESIAIEETEKYDGLIQLIGKQLCIELNLKILKVEYKVEFSSKRIQYDTITCSQVSVFIVLKHLCFYSVHDFVLW